jgi:hypothetical protein
MSLCKRCFTMRPVSVLRMGTGLTASFFTWATGFLSGRLEHILAHSAHGTHPVFRDFLEWGARSHAAVRVTQSRIIDILADRTSPFFHCFPPLLYLQRNFMASLPWFFQPSQIYHHTILPVYPYLSIQDRSFKTGRSARRAIFFLILQNEMIFYHNQINFFFRKGNRRETE